jgi:hypothetical protein
MKSGEKANLRQLFPKSAGLQIANRLLQPND